MGFWSFWRDMMVFNWLFGHHRKNSPGNANPVANHDIIDADDAFIGLNDSPKPSRSTRCHNHDYGGYHHDNDDYGSRDYDDDYDDFGGGFGGGDFFDDDDF